MSNTGENREDIGEEILEKIMCHNCQKYFDHEDVNTCYINDQKYCDDCYEKRFMICNNCREETFKNESNCCSDCLEKKEE